MKEFAPISNAAPAEEAPAPGMQAASLPGASDTSPT